MTHWRLPPGQRFILCIYRRSRVFCNMVERLQLLSAGLQTNDAPFDSGQSNEHNTYMFAMSLRTHASCTVTLRLLHYTTAVNHYINAVNSRQPTVASNMVKVSHALNHSATAAVMTSTGGQLSLHVWGGGVGVHFIFTYDFY